MRQRIEINGMRLTEIRFICCLISKMTGVLWHRFGQGHDRNALKREAYTQLSFVVVFCKRYARIQLCGTLIAVGKVGQLRLLTWGDLMI